MKKILIILIILLTGCSKQPKISEIVKIGDYVKYEAGTWTKEILSKYDSSKRPNVHGTFSLYGLTPGDSKDNSIIKGCYSDKFKTNNSGWIVLKILDNQVYLIHSGIPACYYHASGLKANESVDALDKFVKDNFLNKKYASYARNVKCEDLTTTGKCNFESENLIENDTVYQIEDYYWLSSTFDNIRLYNYEVYINSFGRSHDISFGVRPVIILKENVYFDGTGDGSKENPYKLVKS